MNKTTFFFLLLLPFASLSQKTVQLNSTQLLSTIDQKHDTLLVLNFWATWCKPCVEELPWFDALSEKYKSGKMRMLFVNLDFNSKVESLVEPFVLRKGFHTPVIHITDTDPNIWINRIDSTWSGAIPATVMYKNGQKVFFHEGQVSEKELESILKKLIPVPD